ncbi:MAG: acyl carrier protein [Myxococcota bacterium]
MKNELKNRILQLISDACEVPITEIEPENNIVELGLDSLSLTEIAFKLKKEFGIQGVQEDFDFVETVGEVLSVVENASQ